MHPRRNLNNFYLFFNKYPYLRLMHYLSKRHCINNILNGDNRHMRVFMQENKMTREHYYQGQSQEKVSGWAKNYKIFNEFMA